MRPGRPLRPALAGWRLGIAASLVLLAPIIVVYVLLVESSVLEDTAAADDAAALAQAGDQSAVQAGQQASLLSDGQELTQDVTLQDTPSAEAEPPPEPEPEEEEEGDQIYVVVPGDTLASIARRHGTDVFALAAYNEIEDINRLDVGQRLAIPPPGYEAPPPEEDEEPAPTNGPPTQ